MIANPTAEELKFKTKADGYVNVHPSSVNAKVAVYEVGSVHLIIEGKYFYRPVAMQMLDLCWLLRLK